MEKSHQIPQLYRTTSSKVLTLQEKGYYSRQE